MPVFRFSQVDVFTVKGLLGNPVAVVHGADSLDSATMARFARWTNLSETTFICKPTAADADYRLRIFTPGGELPFAGHPTLGSCRAWLAAGGIAQSSDKIVQQCGIGNVAIREREGQLGFAAPPLTRTGPLDPASLTRIQQALQLTSDDVVSHQWVCNGPDWAAVMLPAAEAVRSLKPAMALLGDLKVGVIGKEHTTSADFDYEVRAFAPGIGVPEDPVTGSLNAGLAIWLMSEGVTADRYVAAQGSALQRSGRVLIEKDESGIWVYGDTTICIEGSLTLT